MNRASYPHMVALSEALRDSYANRLGMAYSPSTNVIQAPNPQDQLTQMKLNYLGPQMVPNANPDEQPTYPAMRTYPDSPLNFSSDDLVKALLRQKTQNEADLYYRGFRDERYIPEEVGSQ